MTFLITCGPYYRGVDEGIGGHLWTARRENAEVYVVLPPCGSAEGWEIEPLDYNAEELEDMAARSPFRFSPRFAEQFT